MVRPRRSLQGNSSSSQADKAAKQSVVVEPAVQDGDVVVDEGGAGEENVKAASVKGPRKKPATTETKRKRNSEIVDEQQSHEELDEAHTSEEAHLTDAAIQEPRKRRLASLNAEFLVHYVSTATSHQPATTAETPAVVVKEEETAATTAESKRRRTVSQDSAGRSGKETKPAVVQPSPTNGRNKRKQQMAAARAKRAANMAAAAAAAAAESDADSEAAMSEENAGGEERETGASRGRKTGGRPGRHVAAANSANRNSEQSFGESEADEAEVETKPVKKRASRGRPSRASRLKRSDSAEESAADVKPSVMAAAEPVSSGRPKREASMRASAMIIQTNEIEKTRFQYYSPATTTLNATTPGPVTPAQNGAKHHTTTAAAANTRSGGKKTSPVTAEPVRVKAELNSSKGEFQVPAPPPAAKKGHHATPEHPTTHGNKRRQNGEKVKFQLGASSPAGSSPSAQLTGGAGSLGIQSPSVLTSIQSSSLRQISTTTTLATSVMPSSTGVNCNGAELNEPDDEDNESNDIQIVAERAGTGKNGGGSRSKLNSNDRPLTEDLLAEHNKLHGTISSSGGGTFSNYTREYITKWALEYKPSSEKPFPPGQIPIESYGIKVVADQQYVAGKGSKQTYHLITTGSGQAKTDGGKGPSAEASVVPTTNAASFPKQPPATTNGQKTTNGGVSKLTTASNAPAAVKMAAAEPVKAASNTPPTSATPAVQPQQQAGALNGSKSSSPPPNSSSSPAFPANKAAASQIVLLGT